MFIIEQEKEDWYTYIIEYIKFLDLQLDNDNTYSKNLLYDIRAEIEELREKYLCSKEN